MDSVASICVARHGETAWNHAGILQGWSDVPLNDQGRHQAYEMADAYADKGFTAIWSSPLRRALETAEIIARRLRLKPPHCHDGIKERCFGAIQGVPKTELAELNPALLQQILRRNPATEFEGGETTDEFAERILVALMDIGTHSCGGRVLLITHGWVMDVITRHVRGLPRSEILNLKRKNGESLWLQISSQSIHEQH